MKKKTLEFKPIWLIAPVVVAAFILVVYYLKDIYPFGNGSVLVYDWYNGTFPASLMHIYDAWHSGSLFYDFTSATGFGRSVLLTLLQPQYVFALFWERENLIDAMAILLLIKFMVVAFTSSYSFSKIFPKVSDLWVFCGALMYTFCGFNLQYYSNIDWLDTVALFPLLVVFTLNLFKGKSKIPYFLIMAYLLITNVYTAFFIFIALIVFGGLYIFIIEEKANRKYATYNLGVGTGAALVAGASSIWNFISKILQTKRFEMTSTVSAEAAAQENGSTGGFLGIFGSENQIDIIAVFMFLGMAISIASLFALWFRFKSHKERRKYTVFFSITMLLFVLQIVFMGVMLIWHAGSYIQFPFRNGYMVAFFCVCILLYYQQHFGDLDGVKFKRPVFNLIPFLPCFFIGIAIASYATVFYYCLENGFNVVPGSAAEMQTGSFKYPYSCFALLLVIGFILIRLVHYKKVRNILSVGLVVAILFSNAYCLVIDKKTGYTGYLMKENIYEQELDVRDNVKDYDALSRVNNVDVSKQFNYDYVAGVPALTNWTHSLSSQQINSIVSLGYSNLSTIIFDSGGTVFSDALLRITTSFADCELDERLYEKYATSSFNTNYYKNRFVLPVGVVCDKTISEISADKYENTFEYQNAIYKSISDGELFSAATDAVVKDEYTQKEFFLMPGDDEISKDATSIEVEIEERDVCTSTFEIPISGEKVLYFAYKNFDENPAIEGIKVNGEPFVINDGPNSNVQSADDNSSGASVASGAFPGVCNNNVLNLGVFEDETVTVSAAFSEDEGNSDSLIFYTMDLDKTRNLCHSLPRNEYSVNRDVVSFDATGTDESNIAFIPLGYSENWECSVNGKDVKPICVLGNFIGIEIEKGENKVVMSYSHKPTYERILLISVLFLVGLGILLIERKIKVPEIVCKITIAAFALIFVGGMLIVYIVPVGYSVVTQIISLIKG